MLNHHIRCGRIFAARSTSLILKRLFIHSTHIEPKAWYKLVKPEISWSQLPLTEQVEVVHDLKEAIKIAVAPKLDRCSVINLVVKASKFDNKDVNNAVEFDAEKSLASI